MNLEGISKQLPVDRLSSIESSRIGRLKKAPKAGTRADEADTSLLSQLMSKSVKEMKTLREPRDKVIQAHQDSLDKPIKVTPQITSTIFKRMISG
ncbi:MAG: hypothetical protein V2A34_07185 [Lentisphaerota bacterium]